MTTIYQKLMEIGAEIDSHESDLYVRVTPETIEIISEYVFKGNVCRFKYQTDGQGWFEIPLAYDPYWDNRLKK